MRVKELFDVLDDYTEVKINDRKIEYYSGDVGDFVEENIIGPNGEYLEWCDIYFVYITDNVMCIEIY